MKQFNYLILSLFVFSCLPIQAQERRGYEKVREEIDSEALYNLQSRLSQKWKQDSIKIEEFREKHGDDAVFQILDDGTVIRLVGFREDGTPIYYETHNAGAASTSNSDEVKPGGSSPYNLTGQGVIIGIWDGGDVRATHQEFGNRVTIQDNAGVTSHATHVGGTIAAGGVDPAAEGMSPQAQLWSWSYSGNESAQMSGFAAQGNILSNHSYGTIAGWRWRSGPGVWRWYGDTTVSGTEDYNYGRYSSKAELWDTIVFANPYYTVSKSAGNNRNSVGPGPNNPAHEIRHPTTNNWVPSTTPRPADCPTGYKCITTYSNAKNIITVGAVEEVQNYTGPASVNMSSFSSWGPTDDGRLKPEIVAKGVSVYSSDSDNDSDYGSKSGTSMSTPVVTGNIGLIQHLHDSLYSTFLKAATVKALIVETAMEAGTGYEPDYAFGYGLMDTKAACDVVAKQNPVDTIIEHTLLQGDTFTMTVTASGNEPLSATLAWTDPPGEANWPVVLNDTTPTLVNDLDMVLIDSNGNQHEPFVLDPANPSAVATRGNNRLDNLEKVLINAPDAGEYILRITHKDTLKHGLQEFGLVVSSSNLIGCYTPHEITDVFIGVDEAVLTWNSYSGAPQHEFIVVPEGSGISAGTPVLVNADTAALTGLMPVTEYDFYVRDICSPGDTSQWTPAFMFRTNCSVTSMPFIEDFDGPEWVSGSGGSNNNDAIDSCWFRVPNTSDDFFWGTRAGQTASSTTGPAGDNTTGSGNYIFTEGSNGSSGDPARITTPLVDMSNAVNPVLTYAYHMNGSNIETLYIKVNSGTGWSVLDSIEGQQQTDENDPWLTDTIDLSGFVGDTVQIRFFTERGSSWRNDIAVDDVHIINRYQNDVGITAIDPITESCLDDQVSIAVAVTNFGLASQSGFDVELSFAGSSAVTETQTFTGTLAAESVDTLVFDSIPIQTGGVWQLTAFTLLGSDQNTENDTAFFDPYILNVRPDKPQFSSNQVTACGTGDTLLTTTSQSEERIYWYDAAGNELAYGDSFLLQLSGTPDTISVVKTVKSSSKVGPEDNTFGGGGTFSSLGSQQLIFDVHEPLIIDSLTVYPGSSGDVSVRVRNSLGGFVDMVQRQVNPANPGDAQRIHVGIEMEPGTGYQIDAAGSSVSNLYRNSSGAVYPYTADNGAMSITGSSFSNESYYYFFYDWEIKSYSCPSEPEMLYVQPSGPEVDLGNDTGYCAGVTDFELVLDAQNPGDSFYWNTGDTSQTITVDTAGSYSVTVTDQNGCDVSDQLIVFQFILPNVSLDNEHLCEGDTIELSVPDVFTEYVWSPGNETTPEIEVTQGGQYDVTVIDMNGCESSSSAEVTETPLPNPDLGDVLTLPEGESLELNSGYPGADHEWSTGETTSSITVMDKGVYSVTVTDVFGCSGSDSVIVDYETGINSIGRNQNIKVYPNPTTGELNLEIEGYSGVVGVELYDVSGKLLFSRSEPRYEGSERIELNLNSYSKGVYFLKVKTDKKSSNTLKISKM